MDQLPLSHLTVLDLSQQVDGQRLAQQVSWPAVRRSRRLLGHRQIEGVSGQRRFRVERAGERPLPVEVDGDYVGEYDIVEYAIAPRSLAVVA